MDKETLSHYGWIVILVLILSVLLALATPFGNFIAEGFKATYAGFGIVSDKALGIAIPGADNGTKDEPIAGGVIPDGGIYYVGVADTEVGDYAGYTTMYGPGENFPETVNDGDIYVYHDYEYRYNKSWMGAWGHNDDLRDMHGDYGVPFVSEGWGVRVLVDTKDAYGQILTSINEKPITGLCGTFMGCSNLKVAPAIPSTVTNLYGTYYSCTSMTTASALPSNLVMLPMTYFNCSSLTSLPELSKLTNLRSMFSAFAYCTSLTNLESYYIPNSVVTLECTFLGCENLTVAPKLPSNLITLRQAFGLCSSLETAPAIPYGTREMFESFASCSSLKNVPRIPATVWDLQYCFNGCNSIEGSIQLSCTYIRQGESGDHRMQYWENCIAEIEYYHIDGCDGSCGY